MKIESPGDASGGPYKGGSAGGGGKGLGRAADSLTAPDMPQTFCEPQAMERHPEVWSKMTVLHYDNWNLKMFFFETTLHEHL